MRQIIKNWKILAIGISFILLDLFLSAWFIFGWRPPFYDIYLTRKNTKKGTQWVVFGTVVAVDKTKIFLKDISGNIKEYSLSQEAVYYRALTFNDKEFTKGLAKISPTLPKIGDWVGLNLFDENNKGKFSERAVFLPLE